MMQSTGLTSRKHRRRLLLDVLLIGMLSFLAEGTRFSYKQGRALPCGDSAQYVASAEALLTPGAAPHFEMRKPGYIFYLAGVAWLFGNMGWAATAGNHVLLGLLPLAAYGIGRRLRGRILGWAAALLVMVRLQFVVWGDRVLSEPLFLALFSFGWLALFVGWSRERNLGWMVTAGTLMGLAWLTRGSATPVIAAVALMFLILSLHGRHGFGVAAASAPASPPTPHNVANPSHSAATVRNRAATVRERKINAATVRERSSSRVDGERQEEAMEDAPNPCLEPSGDTTSADVPPRGEIARAQARGQGFFRSLLFDFDGWKPAVAFGLPVLACILFECGLNLHYAGRFRPSNGTVGATILLRARHFEGATMPMSPEAERVLAFVPERSREDAYLVDHLDIWVARYRAIHDAGMDEWAYDDLMGRVGRSMLADIFPRYLVSSLRLTLAHLLRDPHGLRYSPVPASRRIGPIRHPDAPPDAVWDDVWYAYYGTPHLTPKASMALAQRMHEAAAIKAPFGDSPVFRALRYWKSKRPIETVLKVLDRVGRLWPGFALLACGLLGLNRRLCGVLALAYLLEAMFIGFLTPTNERLQFIWVVTDTTLVAGLIVGGAARVATCARSLIARRMKTEAGSFALAPAAQPVPHG